MTEGIDPNSDSDAHYSSRLYLPGETLYGAVAPRALELGWTIIPQERGERRISAKVDGRSLKWGQYVDQAPTPADVQHWANQAPGANGAILLGPPSGLVFCFDIDVYDRKLSEAIQWLATETMGETRFARQGEAPKMALFYRVATLEELPPNRSYRFVDEAGTGVSDHMIEIQGRGKIVTAFGYHHKTDRYFQWEGPQPASHSTEDVPLVTREQIELFIDAVQDLRPFHRNTPAGGAILEFTPSAGGSVQRPKYKIDENNQPWVVDPASGLIVDGRESYIWDVVQATVRRNPDFAATNEGVAQLRGDILEQIEDSLAKTGRWTSSYIRQHVGDKVGRAVRDLREGRTKPIGPTQMRAVAAPRSEHQFLMLADRRVELRAEFAPISDDEKQRRKLNTDRGSASAKIAQQISNALTQAFDAVYAGRVEEVHSIPGATGSGKTSQAIRMIEADPRTYWDDMLPADSEERVGPWVFMLPTYNNVSELKERADVLGLDPNLDDEELMAAALMIGIHPHDRTMDDIRTNAAASKLRTMVYQGKKKAGCAMEAVLEPLMGAGIRTGQLCKSIRKDAYGKDETVYCAHYHGCPAIAQRHQIPNSHIVFVVQNFLTLSVPEELTKVRGVILDERVFHLVLHHTTMSISTLEKARKEPRLTKQERDAGMNPRDLLQDRDDASFIAVNAMLKGEDPAEALLRDRYGFRIVESAKRVNGNAMSVEQAVFPNMSVEQVSSILAQPTGHQVAEEWRFWDTVLDRMNRLLADYRSNNIAPRSEALAAGDLDGVVAATKHDVLERKPQQAMGKTDARLQYLSSKDAIRISWQTDMKWADRTRILLDASMDERITERIFPDANIIEHPIDTDLNLRVLYACDQNWAITGVLPQPSDGPADMAAKANKVAEIRRHIAKVGGIYAHGCVVYVMPKKIRAAVTKDWVVPYNIDIRHHGAVKGLDFGKEHVAVVSLGRLEPPTEAIDGQVGAATFRDPEPEQPIDRFGTGQTEDGKDIYQQRVKRRVKLRDQDAFIEGQEYAGPLAQALQLQFREEEGRQIIGRVRPIHRSYTADVIFMGQSLPSDIVVDALTTFDAMMMNSPFWDLVRRCGGIIDVEAMAKRSPIPMTAEAVQQWFDAIKHKDEILKRYHRITSKTAAGKVVQWYIPAYFSADENVVRSYAGDCAPTDEILTIRMSELTVVPHARAPKDAIDGANGTVAEQYQREAAALRPAIEMTIRRGQYKPGALLVAAGEGEYERTRLAIDAWPILNAWIAERKKKADEAAGIEQPEVAAVEEAAPVQVGQGLLAPGESYDDWDDRAFA